MKNVTIVSLSSGIIGEQKVKHETDIGVKRLNKIGLNVKFSSHALCGLQYIKDHPEDRARDLLDAYNDEKTDMILCANGGDDTYRLMPYLFDNDELKNAVKGKKKIFLGFSDTTFNHFMLHKLGVKTFYGQSFLADICELDNDMLPYTYHYFNELVSTGSISEIRPSDVWYEERTDFSAAAVGTKRVSHKNSGFELLQGSPVFSGEILGGCIDSIYDMFNNDRYSDSVDMCRKYSLFPSKEEWRGKILLLESSEEQPSPELYRKMLAELKNAGVFGAVNGVLVGKPMDERYYDDYKKILVDVIDDRYLPIVYNVNIGHATPRCIIPFGVNARVDAEEQVIYFG